MKGSIIWLFLVSKLPLDESEEVPQSHPFLQVVFRKAYLHPKYNEGRLLLCYFY